MSKLKKITAVLSAAMVSATLFGCADTSYIMKADGEEVKTGVYVNYAATELNTQIQTLMQAGTTSDYLSQKVDGKNMKDYISDAAMKSTKELVAINNQFDEMKLKLDEETLKSINNSVNEAWTSNQKTYENQGVGKESLKNIARASYKRQAVFDAIYGKDGTEAVADKDVTKYVDENYVRYKILTIAKSAASTDDSSKADDSSSTVDESKELFDKYLKEAKTLDFDGFDKVIEEYEAYQQAQAAAESQAAKTEAGGEVPTIDLTSGVDATVSVATAEAEGDDESVAEVTEGAADTAAEEVADTAADESSSEAEEHSHDYMSDYNDITEDQLKETVGKILTEIKDKLKVDQVSSFEDDNAYYIFVKGDASERSNEYVEDETKHSTVLTAMKGDEFQSKIDSWVEKIKFDVNNDTLKQFSVEEIYNKMNESTDSN